MSEKHRMRNGGSKLIVPHSGPTIDESEVEAASAALRSGFIAQGQGTATFEEALAKRLGLKEAAATSSGTAALHIALLALGVGPGDEVLMPSYVCAALLQVAAYVGAKPVIVDIDPETYNIDPENFKAHLSARAKAAIVPHTFGLPAPLAELMTYGIAIIEDCAHAIGATYMGRPVGSFGEAAIVSFAATKMLTTGEGGAMASHSDKIIDRARDLRDYDEKEVHHLRFNYKFNDIGAAIGLSQLSRLDHFIERRRRVAMRYCSEIGASSLTVPSSASAEGRVFYRFPLKYSGGAEELIAKMAQRGIGCARPVFKPLHRYLGLDGYPGADEAWRTTISIPLYPSLCDSEIELVIRSLSQCAR